ncbi:hypothetical protein [Bartonella bovis]|uniref:hypothetical protein n=1 Tax=Bartonella bovis TaxID=155194 RepID=UPI00039F7B18|nr:hypothetical protein [Bartonella bovis]
MVHCLARIGPNHLLVNGPEDLNRSAYLIKTEQLLSCRFHGCGPFLSKEKMLESVDDTNNKVGLDE